MKLVLGEIDVARAEPKPRQGGKPSVRTATGAHPSRRGRPPTVRRATRGRLRHGGRRPPGPDYVGLWGMGRTCGEDTLIDRLIMPRAHLHHLFICRTRDM